MKKIILLAAAIAALTMTACGSRGTETDATADSTTVTNDTTVVATDSVAVDTVTESAE